jgi:hypothetical protein
MEDEQDKGCN